MRTIEIAYNETELRELAREIEATGKVQLSTSIYGEIQKLLGYLVSWGLRSDESRDTVNVFISDGCLTACYLDVTTGLTRFCMQGIWHEENQTFYCHS